MMTLTYAPADDSPLTEIFDTSVLQQRVHHSPRFSIPPSSSRRLTRLLAFSMVQTATSSAWKPPAAFCAPMSPSTRTPVSRHSFYKCTTKRLSAPTRTPVSRHSFYKCTTQRPSAPPRARHSAHESLHTHTRVTSQIPHVQVATNTPPQLLHRLHKRHSPSIVPKHPTPAASQVQYKQSAMAMIKGIHGCTECTCEYLP